MHAYTSLGLLLLVCWQVGCGTTRWTDTPRTATEQVLLSDAIEQAVDQLDFSPFAGQAVYLDTRHLDGTVDKGYLASCLRQRLVDSGCLMKAEREEAVYVVEVRSGAVATNRNDSLLGIPSTPVPAFLFGGQFVMPEIALVKRTTQTAITKVATFAYHQSSGMSTGHAARANGYNELESRWYLGMGPFERGSIELPSGHRRERGIFSLGKHQAPASDDCCPPVSAGWPPPATAEPLPLPQISPAPSGPEPAAEPVTPGLQL